MGGTGVSVARGGVGAGLCRVTGAIELVLGLTSGILVWFAALSLAGTLIRSTSSTSSRAFLMNLYL